MFRCQRKCIFFDGIDDRIVVNNSLPFTLINTQFLFGLIRKEMTNIGLVFLGVAEGIMQFGSVIQIIPTGPLFIIVLGRVIM